jgi:hypothetical protein
MIKQREVGRRAWGALVAVPLVVALVVALGLAGCGKGSNGGGVATVSGAGAGGQADGAKPTPTLSMQDAMLKFAQCMREHGVDMKDPDVDEDGHFAIKIGGGPGTPANKEKVDAAMKACRQYMPNGGEPPKADPEMAAKMRKMAECMRANGVPNYPDPDPETGGIMIQGGPDTGLDPMSPTFKAAQAKCHNEAGLPEPQGGTVNEESGGDGGGAGLEIHGGG